MTTKNINFKSKILSIFLAVILLLSNCGFLTILFNSNKQVFASEQTEVSITNSSFDDDIVSGSIVSPTGWSKVNSESNVTSGIISLNQTIFEKQMTDSYKLSFKPKVYQDMQDEQVLMLNAKTEKLHMGYQSENITLNSNSYYKMTFRALTEDADYNVIASANLTNSDILTNSVITIVTNGNWNEYTFLIETSKISSLETNLQLWLGLSSGEGSYGAVFFDDVHCYELSENTYQTIFNANQESANYYFCSLNTTKNSEQFANNDFENATLTDWTILTGEGYTTANQNNYAGIVNFNMGDYSSAYKLSEKPVDANLYNNTQALLINNQEASIIGYKSSSITIKQHHFYKISILSKADISTGSAYIYLKENNPYSEYTDDEFGLKTFNTEVSSTSTSETTNNWIEYSFYIQARSFEDTSIYLELWLGKDESAVGYVMFDNIQVYEISYSEYTSGKSQSNSTDADYSASTSLTIPNGKFNLVESDGANDNYPYAPQNWVKATSSNSSTNSGVINTLDTSMIESIVNPTSSNKYSQNNNILMIGNIGANAQTYTTESTFTLSANSYYKLSFKVQTQKLTNGASAGFKLYTDTLTLKELMYIESNSTWTSYTLYIKTGLNSYDCNVELSLGSKNNGSGYAFFDDVVLTSTTEDNYNSSLTTNSYKINLATDNFTNTSNKKVDGLYTTNSMTENNVSGTNGVVAGVVDVTSADAMSGKLTGELNPNLPTDDSGNKLSGNVMVIKSNQDTNYTLTTKETYTLQEDTFYKISVWALTRNLSQQEENKTEITNSADYYPYGASIKLTTLDKTFSGIDTQNKWVQYSFYINSTEEQDIQIVLSLGTSNALTSGTVFFTNLTVETIEEDDYFAGIKPLEEDETIDNIMAIGSTEIDTPDDDTDEEATSFDWLLIPTLITSIALIVAIVAIAIKQFVKKHPRKVKLGKLAYNREITLEKDFEHFEQLKANQAKIEELKQQLEQIKLNINEAKQEYKLEEKEHKEQLSKELDAQKSTKSKSELKKYSKERTLQFKLDRLTKYKTRQKELEAKYHAIELEIEAIYQEELRLIKLYKEYRKQVKIKKQELKQQKKK